MAGDETRPPGPVRRFWRWLWRPTRHRWALGIPLAGAIIAFIAGIMFWGGFHWAMASTNTLEFCISCHEMEDNVYAEYVETSHYKNTSGVRAICSDCHVPHEWGPKVIRKIKATGELYGALIGKIDTPEKFEAHRLEMAERVWAEMESNDSRECRNCHSFESMDLEAQDRRTARKHSPEWRERTGDTCIDCHKGIAHDMPDPG